MNEQNNGLGSSTPSNVPMKRKRGQPCEEESGVQGEKMSVTPGPVNVLNSNQTVGTTDDCDHEMLGKELNIIGTFDGGYFVSCQKAGVTYRGVVFQPEEVVPLIEENDYDTIRPKTYKRDKTRRIWIQTQHGPNETEEQTSETDTSAIGMSKNTP